MDLAPLPRTVEVKLKKKLLVVDDDRLVRNLVQRVLSETYEVTCAENGTQGIELARERHPDFILLDVEMPGMNGYEMCDQIKQDDATSHIPVVFLSSHIELRERMLGYEVGATDFLAKPFEAPELKAKLAVLTDYVESRSALSEQARQASETAFTAMRGSSELGFAIQFIESSYNTSSLEKLADRFLAVTTNLSLSCTLMILSGEGHLFFSSRGHVSPLEHEVMQKLFHSGKRFNDFGCRTQINYQRVALLIKNMPLDDPETYGRFKDFLPTMLGATDEKIKALDTEQALIKQTQNLVSSFGAVRTTLSQVGEELQGTQSRVLSLLRTTIAELDARIPTLGLEEDQEKYLIDTLDGALNSTHDIIESGEHARDSFQTVIRLLEHLSERQHRLLQDATRQQNEDSGADEESAADSTGDIELF